MVAMAYSIQIEIPPGTIEEMAEGFMLNHAFHNNHSFLDLVADEVRLIK